MKNINWKNIATIVVFSILTIAFVYPLVRPLLQKIPFLGSRVA